MKLLAWAVLFTVACFAAWPQVPRDRGQQQEPTQSKDGKAQSSKQPCVCNVQVQETAPKEEHSPQPKSYQWRELYSPTNVPSWVLALVAAWAGYLALKTLRAIKRQADIQEASMRQWVDVEIVGIEPPDMKHPDSQQATRVVICIKFRAINNTLLPFTIKKIVTRISRNRGHQKPEWEVFEVDEEMIVPPFKEGNGSSYPFFVMLDLEEAAIKEYLDSKFVVSISGQVFFEPAVGRRVEQQSFGYMTACGLNGIRTLQPLGKEPRKRN